MMNIANVLYSFGDNITYNKLKKLIMEDDKSMTTTIEEAVQRIRKLNYNAQKIETLDVFNANQRFPMICKISSTHVVAVYKGQIFDAESRYTMTLNDTNLDIACGAGTEFHGISKSYLLIPNTKTLKRITMISSAKLK